MIVNRILIKFETASFKIIPDTTQNPSKTFSSLLETKVKFFQSENRNYQHHFPFSKQISPSLFPENPPETVFSRIFPRDGVEWIFRCKIRETLELSSRRRYRLTRTRLRIEKFSRHRQSGKKLCRMKTGFVWKRGSPSWKESDGSMGAHSPCSLKRNF